MRSISRWLVWLAYSSAWTVALLVPPIHISPLGEVDGLDLKFLLAKSLHVTAYAVLAVLTGWLRVRSRYRWILMFLLALHAASTEFFQQFVESRTGLLTDMLLDLAGIALGCVLGWKWWSDPA